MKKKSHKFLKQFSILLGSIPQPLEGLVSFVIGDSSMEKFEKP